MTDSKAPILDSQHLEAPAQPDKVADRYADRLMDELFNGVERALEGEVEALDAVPQPDIAETPDTSELTLSFTEGGLPAVLLDSGQAKLSLADQVGETAIAAESAATTAEMLESASQPKRWQDRLTLNRALLGAAGLTLLATLGVWLYQRQTLPITATNPSPAPANTAGSSTDAEFLEYLRRSLDVIAQNAAETATPTTSGVSDVAIALNNGGVGLPPIGNTVLPPQGPNGMPTAPGSINVIERVYVPYPSAAANSPATPGAPAPAGNATAGTPTASAAPVVTHTLLGVLELGERSAALFEIDGVPQRVYIGERIGSSEWSLVSVANEEAVVRRNGEVRTLYIGQRF
jgi:hypothetical protein